MEPVEGSNPIDLDHDPCDEKRAEGHGKLASVTVARERRRGAHQTPEPIYREENDAGNQITRKRRTLEQLEWQSNVCTTRVQGQPQSTRYRSHADEYLEGSQCTDQSLVLFARGFIHCERIRYELT